MGRRQGSCFPAAGGAVSLYYIIKSTRSGDRRAIFGEGKGLPEKGGRDLEPLLRMSKEERVEMMETRYEVLVEEEDSPMLFGVAGREGLEARRLTSDRAEAERLVDALNRNGLSPAHFWDVIEDFRHFW